MKKYLIGATKIALFLIATFLIAGVAAYVYAVDSPSAATPAGPTTSASPATSSAPTSEPSPAKPQTPAPRRGTSPGVPDAHLSYKPGKPPKYWSVATAETIMARYPDYRDAYWKPWSYVQGYMFCGFEMLYRSTGDKKYLDYIKRYIDNFVDDQGNVTLPGNDKLRNLDNMMTGTAIVMLYEYTKDERYKKAAQQFRKVFDAYPRSQDGQFWHGMGPADGSGSPNMWIDGVFMGQMFLIRYGKSIGDSEYCFDEAAKQMIVCAKHLLKGDTGLLLHAWTEKPEKAAWADPKTGLSPDVWSEGLGWYALVLSETLAVMPKDHAKRPELETIFRNLAAGLKRTQDPKTGGWFMIVNKGDLPDNWIDPSGTGMFVYMIQRGIELGLINKDEYGPVVANGYKALLEFAKINENGLVDIHGGGDGITIKKDYDTYIKVKRIVNAKEAVGGFLWAAAIVEKPGPTGPEPPAGQNINSRAAWMQKTRWGVMSHYLADWRSQTDNEKAGVEHWNDLIDHFDVEGLANQIESVKAGYYILTIGQNSGYYLAPNATYDKIVGIQPSKCSKRDLITDVATALNKRGIKLMVYLPSGAPGGDREAVKALEWQNGPHRNREFQIKWEQVIADWSKRWGDKVAGWWFDGCYFPNAMYRFDEAPNFASFTAAARAGNPNSCVAFNPGVVDRALSITPFEDYTANEISNMDYLMIRRATDGFVDGAQVHFLSFLGQRWGRGAPRFTTEQAVLYSRQVGGQNGVISWDVPIQKNGLIAEPFIDQLKAIGEAMSKVVPGQEPRPVSDIPLPKL